MSKDWPPPRRKEVCLQTTAFGLELHQFPGSLSAHTHATHTYSLEDPGQHGPRKMFMTSGAKCFLLKIPHAVKYFPQSRAAGLTPGRARDPERGRARQGPAHSVLGGESVCSSLLRASSPHATLSASKCLSLRGGSFTQYFRVSFLWVFSLADMHWPYSCHLHVNLRGFRGACTQVWIKQGRDVRPLRSLARCWTSASIHGLTLGPSKPFMFSVPSGARSKHLTEWLSHFCRTLGKQFPFLRTGE